MAILSSPGTVPRVSGILNNCAFNCAIPKIIEQIETFASIEGSDASEHLSEAPYYSGYLNFLDLFSRHYQVQPNWRQLKEFFAQHSYAEIEFILAPVFRELLGDATTDSSGRYESVDMYDAVEALYRPLGIEVEVSSHLVVQHYRLIGAENYGIVQIKHESSGEHFQLLGTIDEVGCAGSRLAPEFQAWFDLLSNNCQRIEELKESIDIVYHKIQAELTQIVYPEVNQQPDVKVIEHSIIETPKDVSQNDEHSHHLEFYCMVGFGLAAAVCLVLAAVFPMPFTAIFAGLACASLATTIGIFVNGALHDKGNAGDTVSFEQTKCC